MKRTITKGLKATVIIGTAAWLQMASFTNLALAQDRNNEKLASLLSSLANSLVAENQDNIIHRVFKDVLGREPSSSELRRYRHLMHDQHWTEREIRRDLNSRSDYRRHPQHRDIDPERIIKRAYEDILNREPDRAGLRTYRSHILDDGWTEQDVREALRKSDEHKNQSKESADRIIRRAYKDILGREADYNGLVSYRNQILHHGWDEHDVREAIKRSPEYRQKNTIARAQAENMVRRAYLFVLNRDPDPDGMRVYVDHVINDHWSSQDLMYSMRNSEEFRKKHR